ncbi:hypothetical protein [Blastomonas sp.]|uniref:hypothetical protein n=1 Tax=Blastomonas sp. TaxID=1909299 RepID=UPI0026394A23|nr:hypothetical protein [Blastomonas sp.]MDM7954752.1 hypothetical protein [Blastomonas sp.]
MTSPIILTLAQARDLQQQITAWPSSWHFLLAIERPEKPDAIGDPERMTAGLRMVQLSCSDDHIAEQLGWKIPSGPLKTIHRIIRKQLS